MLALLIVLAILLPAAGMALVLLLNAIRQGPNFGP